MFLKILNKVLLIPQRRVLYQTLNTISIPILHLDTYNKDKLNHHLS